MTSIDGEVVNGKPVKQELELNAEALEAVETLEASLGRVARGRAARNIIDVSDAVVKLVEEYGWSQGRIASTFGASQPTVSNYYSLRLLIPELRARAQNNEMSLRAAVWLSKMIGEDQQEIYEDTKGNYSITQTRVRQGMQDHAEALPIGNIPVPTGEARPERRVEVPLRPAHIEALAFGETVEMKHEGVIYALFKKER